MRRPSFFANQSNPPGPRSRVLLWSLLLLALAVRLVLAFRVPSLYYPDEIFQTTEIAHRFAFGNGVVSWEWREGIRSIVLPFVLSLFMRATVWMGPGSLGYVSALRVLMSLLSLTSVWFCYHWAQKTAGDSAALIAGFTAACWSILIFFSVKTFNEVFAADCFFPGLLLAIECWQHRRMQWCLAGLLLGAATALRIQMLPTVLVALVWICWSDRRERLVPVLGGFLVPLCLFGLVDGLTLSYPFQSFVRYVWVNVGTGKSLTYGRQPWDYFLVNLLRYCAPLLLPAFFGLRRSPILGWLLLALVGSHSVLAHKEFRFIYAALPLIIALFAVGCVELSTRYMPQWSRSRRQVGLLALLVCIAVSSLLTSRHLPGWHRFADVIQTEQAASHDLSVCGIGIYAFPWWNTGGYTDVHRNIPMLVIPDSATLDRTYKQYNLLITWDTQTPPMNGYTPLSCGERTCTYRRAGPCSSPGENEINLYAKRTGK